MAIYDGMFIIAFLAMVIITFVKFYNALNVGKVYDIKIGFMLFAGYLIAWVTGFIVFAANPETLIYHMLFRLSSWLLGLNTLFILIELIINLRDTAEKQIGAYNSKEVEKAARF